MSVAGLHVPKAPRTTAAEQPGADAVTTCVELILFTFCFEKAVPIHVEDIRGPLTLISTFVGTLREWMLPSSAGVRPDGRAHPHRRVGDSINWTTMSSRRATGFT